MEIPEKYQEMADTKIKKWIVGATEEEYEQAKLDYATLDDAGFNTKYEFSRSGFAGWVKRVEDTEETAKNTDANRVYLGTVKESVRQYVRMSKSTAEAWQDFCKKLPNGCSADAGDAAICLFLDAVANGNIEFIVKM